MTVTWQIHQGDVLDCLRRLPAQSVHCAITSPPYYGLRDYGLPPSIWGGRDPACEHEWGDAGCLLWARKLPGPNGETKNVAAHARRPINGALCARCGAWRGCLGLEPTPQLYVDHLVLIMREVRRILHRSGTLWLVIGDSYAGSWGNCGGQNRGRGRQRPITVGSQPTPAWDGREAERPAASRRLAGLKPKDLIGIPWAAAFALRDDGWWLRADNIWHKPNGLTESVDDRTTKAHEYVFHFSTARRYFYDREPIREPHDPASLKRYEYGLHSRMARSDSGVLRANKTSGVEDSARMGDFIDPAGRNCRSVWTIPTSPFVAARVGRGYTEPWESDIDHYAAFPSALVERCLIAGTSAHGGCADCGAPYERVVERTDEPDPTARGSRFDEGKTGVVGAGRVQAGERMLTRTAGWRRTCRHADAGVVPAVVLDPFCGTGTTGLVALRHGRRFIGIELNPEYVEMARRRLIGDAPLFNPQEDARAD